MSLVRCPVTGSEAHFGHRRTLATLVGSGVQNLILLDIKLTNSLRGALLLETRLAPATTSLSVRETIPERGNSVLHDMTSRLYGALLLSAMLASATAARSVCSSDPDCKIISRHNNMSLVRCPVTGSEAHFDHGRTLGTLGGSGVQNMILLDIILIHLRCALLL